MTTLPTTIDAAEIERFSAIAAEWWNPLGKFRPLHNINPVRLGHIRDTALRHFGLDARSRRPLSGLRILDIGCGGGLVAEPLARLGGDVVGIDAAERNIAVASVHARESGLAIDYRFTSAEALADAGEQFDVVLALEVIEHVADVPLFLSAASRLVRPGGVLMVATMNRTLKSFAMAIVGAEYVLRWLPRGTHDWNKFLRPSEVAAGIRANGLGVGGVRGMSYSPLGDRWSLSADTTVNYILTATRPA